MRVKRRAVVAIAIVALIGGVAAVERRIPARIDVGGDTLIINGLQPVAIGARAINRHGSAIWRPRLRYTEDSASIAHVRDDGSVKCSGVGDDVITIVKGLVSRALLVRCRPIHHFEFIHSAIGLRVGGPPKTIAVGAIGYDGKPVELLQGRATLSDSTAVLLRGNMVYPVGVGVTEIHFEFSGGMSTDTYVAVSKAVVDTTVTLVAGEIRTWRVAPGRYAIDLSGIDTTEATPLVLAAANANCARGLEGPQHYYCIMKSTSSIVVANPRQRGSASARLTAVQRPTSG